MRQWQRNKDNDDYVQVTTTKLNMTIWPNVHFQNRQNRALPSIVCGEDLEEKKLEQNRYFCVNTLRLGRCQILSHNHEEQFFKASLSGEASKNLKKGKSKVNFRNIQIDLRYQYSEILLFIIKIQPDVLPRLLRTINSTSDMKESQCAKYNLGNKVV